MSAAHNEHMMVLRELGEFFDRRMRLLAFAMGVRNTLEVRQWINGEAQPNAEQWERLRCLARVIQMLSSFDSPTTITAWLIHRDDNLGDQSPLVVLRQGDMVEFDSAARRWIATG